MILYRTNNVTLWEYHLNGKTVTSLAMSKHEDGVLLFRLFTRSEFRRRGLATDLIRDVLANCQDDHVYVSPSPFLDEPMSKALLWDWYERLGFRRVDETTMRWERQS